MALYLVSGLVVAVGSGVMAMAGLGAAFVFVPMFYYLGVPLPEAGATALLLNAVSLSFATANYWRGRLINWRVALPVAATAVALAPIGAILTTHTNRRLLLGLFAGFLVFAGALMLRSRKPVSRQMSRGATLGTGAATGGVAGLLGGLLGVGGGNVVLPVLNWLGLDAKVTAGTTALVVVCSSLSGFLGHASLQTLQPTLLLVTGIAAAAGSLAGSQLTRTKLPASTLKRITAVLLFAIAAKMLWDLLS